MSWFSLCWLFTHLTLHLFTYIYLTFILFDFKHVDFFILTYHEIDLMWSTSSIWLLAIWLILPWFFPFWLFAILNLSIMTLSDIDFLPLDFTSLDLLYAYLLTFYPRTLDHRHELAQGAPAEDLVLTEAPNTERAQFTAWGLICIPRKFATTPHRWTKGPRRGPVEPHRCIDGHS